MWDRTVGSPGTQPGQFQYPHGLALTHDDAFLLVADPGNLRVVVLRATDGVWVRQLKGADLRPLQPRGGLLHPSRWGGFRQPWGVSVVPSTGQVLVSDVSRHEVIQFRSIEDDSVVGTLGSGQGSGLTQFQSPIGLAILDGPCCPPVLLFFSSTATLL